MGNSIDVNFETFPQADYKVSPCAHRVLGVEIDQEEFGTPDCVAEGTTVHEMAIHAFKIRGFEGRDQHTVYVDTANAQRRYQAVFPEIVPKKIPKTYGPPRIGKRGKICKW